MRGRDWVFPGSGRGLVARGRDRSRRQPGYAPDRGARLRRRAFQWGRTCRLSARRPDQLVLSGGFSQLGSSIELTGIGAAQGRDWRSSYAQARLRHAAAVRAVLRQLQQRGRVLHAPQRRPAPRQLGPVGRPGPARQPVRGAPAARLWRRPDPTPCRAPRVRSRAATRTTTRSPRSADTSSRRRRLTPGLDFVAAARLDHHSRIDKKSVLAARGFRRQGRGRPQPATDLQPRVQPALEQQPVPRPQVGAGLRWAALRRAGHRRPRGAASISAATGRGRPLMRSPFTPAGLGGPAQQLPLDVTVFWPSWSRSSSHAASTSAGFPAERGASRERVCGA